ncbi:polysaccharide deacetylase family protein [Pusillimonas sp.]|uniref:polysaccharide deacetylase family protein n=1 Tax=Pusillimonas sp. TaxID=3040095 RepID=UPI0029BAAFA6|nr:polysaccharide deacetylase family protein [Pusillimonas sp.]MDX3893853.1 polysaccharide deacetylase family protein [Pusillimonas sp.]
MDNALYNYSPIVSRPKLIWPDGARVAFYVGLNVEHYQIDKPSTSIFGGTAGLAPDPLNYGWRDYALRVGIWRMMETLDRHGLRASVLLNSECCKHYPQVIEAGKERGWAWLAHGKNNSVFQAGMSIDEERQYLKEVVSTISEATGQSIKGWLGPALTETFETPGLLKELGLSYLLDWCADDQPFPTNIPGMISVPYSIELNDVTMFIGKSLTGEQFYQMVVDQFDQLYADGAQTGRVMALCLHPFIINQPFRHKYLDKALAYIASHEGVWLTTSDEIASYFMTTQTGLSSGS